jgi:hypothetical protein
MTACSRSAFVIFEENMHGVWMCHINVCNRVVVVVAIGLHVGHACTYGALGGCSLLLGP